MYLTNCIIARNHALQIGAICAYSEKLTLTNVTITDNVVDESPAVGGLILEHQARLYVNNSIIYGNQGVDFFTWGENEVDIVYSNIGVPDLTDDDIGNICVDSQFLDEEYHLAETSPCIDTGAPNPRFNDTEDPQNPGYALFPAIGTIRSDMGAYGGNGYNGYYVGAEENEIPNVSTMQLTNYPNPFNPCTTISFNLASEIQGETEVQIYNIKGQKIKVLSISTSNNSSNIQVEWDGTDLTGESVSSGLYFYKINTFDSPINKMILIK